VSIVHSITDEVFSLDRLKQRLQKNMEDRRAEVDARQEIQRREMKLIGEELHGLTVKRQNLLLNIDRVSMILGKESKFDVFARHINKGI
jgi:hypothetical protein